MSQTVTIIVAPQEHDKANHIGLWEQIAAQSVGQTIVLNIGADLAVSIFKRRFYRIDEALRNSFKKVGSYHLLRPFFLVRPEVAGNFVNRLNKKILIQKIERIIPDLKTQHVRVLTYSGLWANFFRETIPHAKIGYYVLDEVTRTASTGLPHARRTELDKTGCIVSDAIFLMSSNLMEPRIKHQAKIKVIGNGADIPAPSIFDKELPIEPRHISIGLIGNIRDWIDTELLEGLISSRPDLEFGLVGNVEANMVSFVNSLVRNHPNATYHGTVPKQEVPSWYRRFDIIIVPYRHNAFMSGTRPIKIVESIFSGVPVVTIPVSGYQESAFIKFATSSNEFSKAIDQLEPINREDPRYKEFLEENSWNRVARNILESLSD